MKLNACTSAKTTLLTPFTGSKLIYSFVAWMAARSGFPFGTRERNKILAAGYELICF